MSQKRLIYPTFGGVNIAPDGYVNANFNRISKLGEPIDDDDACTKRYVTTKLFSVGDLKWSIRTDDDGDWLICDGRLLAPLEYPELYNVIGYNFGSDEDGSFRLPDCRGRTLGCAGTGEELTARSVGDVLGTEAQVLDINNLPAHTHSGTTGSAGSHNHGGTTSSNGSHTHTSNATGGTVGLAISDGTNTVTAADETPGELNVWTTPQALSINSAGEHNHTVSTDGAHTHSFTTSSVGSGHSFSIFQPTIFIGHVFMYGGKRRNRRGVYTTSSPFYTD